MKYCGGVLRGSDASRHAPMKSRFNYYDASIDDIPFHVNMSDTSVDWWSRRWHLNGWLVSLLRHAGDEYSTHSMVSRREVRAGIDT